MITTSFDSAATWLKWSNVLYVGGAALTLLAAMLVFIEKRLVAVGKLKRTLLLTETVVIGAAIISLIGTAGAIHFGNVVSGLKDASLAQYEKGADLKIAQSQNNTATANKEAREAELEAQQTSLENAQLRVQLQNHETQSAAAQTRLEQQNKANYDFAHALAQQQSTMAQQAHVSPILDANQMAHLTALVQPFSGSDVIFHSTSDTPVLRLERTIQVAFHNAGITTNRSDIDMGALYQGVSVAVHSPTDIPPLANALVSGLRDAGIEVHTVSFAAIPAGQVAVYLGPN